MRLPAKSPPGLVQHTQASYFEVGLPCFQALVLGKRMKESVYTLFMHVPSSLGNLAAYSQFLFKESTC